MTVPVDHIQKLRDAATQIVTGLHEMRHVFQEIEGFCLDWVDDAGELDAPHVTHGEPSGNSEPLPDPQPEPAPAPQPEPEPEYPSLEDVRAVLASLAQAGKGAQVKELITRHGADKLSDVAPEDRQALITEAEAIK